MSWYNDFGNSFINNFTNSATQSFAREAINTPSSDQTFYGTDTSKMPFSPSIFGQGGGKTNNDDDDDDKKQKGFFDGLFSWNNALGLLQSGLGAFGSYSQASASREHNEAQLQLQREQLALAEASRKEQLEFEREKLAQMMGAEHAKIAMLKKEIIQRAFATMVNAALTGGKTSSEAMAALGQLGQAPVLRARSAK